MLAQIYDDTHTGLLKCGKGAGEVDAIHAEADPTLAPRVRWAST